MESQNIKVSIICTAFNHERYIRQTLDGFLMQKTTFAYEVLINDDASTDRTAEIIREYEKKYPDIVKPIYQTENQYSIGKSCEGILLARVKGDYVALCEGDDFWIDENKLQLQVDYMDNHPECSLCAHSGYNCYENGVLMKELFRPFDKDSVVPTEEVISRWLFPTASILYRNSMYVEYPIPFRKDAPCGDYPLAVYLALQGTVYYFDRPMSVYRRNSISSLSLMNKNNDQRALKTSIGLLALADRVDEYTNHQYSEAVRNFKRPNEYARLMLLHHHRETVSSEFYKDFSISQRLRLWLKTTLYWLVPLIHSNRKSKNRKEYTRCLKQMETLKIPNLNVLDELK